MQMIGKIFYDTHMIFTYEIGLQSKDWRAWLKDRLQILFMYFCI